MVNLLVSVKGVSKRLFTKQTMCQRACQSLSHSRQSGIRKIVRRSVTRAKEIVLEAAQTVGSADQIL
jgi:hypothetical protein